MRINHRICLFLVAMATGVTSGAAEPTSAGFTPYNGIQPISLNEAVAAETACPPVACQDCDCGCYRLPSCECPTAPAPCLECPHVSTLLPYWNVSVFGALKTDMLFNTARPIAPGTPFLLAPNTAQPENTFDLHARASTLGALLSGPQIGNYKAGGLLLVNFYNDSIVADRYGILPLQAFGELRSEEQRYAAGLQFNVFNPNLPTMLTFSSLIGSGNSGNLFMGQLRYERYLQMDDCSQWTFQAALSDPTPTGIQSNRPLSEIITGVPAPPLQINEDNGWPQIESRLAYAFGEEKQEGLEKKRAFEVGISGAVTQLRTVIPPNPNVVADVYGLAGDWRWRITERTGVMGEAFVGQGMGFLGGGVLQSVNSATFRAIRSRGGWMEVYHYLTPCVHTHWGYGVDDPLDNDLFVSQVTRNQTVYGNVLWDITHQLRVGFEGTWRKTDYVVLPGNEGVGLHTQVQWSF